LQVVDTYKAELFAQLTHLDEILLSKTFLVGERLSLADISVALDLLPAFQHVFDAPIRKKYGNVTRWFQTVVHQPVVKDVLKEVHLCDKVSQFNQAKFNELSSKHQQHHVKHAPKKEGWSAVFSVQRIYIMCTLKSSTILLLYGVGITPNFARHVLQ
ncbi:hypothetical protein TELCIR_11616, partial [Teladorsagia circumcincta]